MARPRGFMNNWEPNAKNQEVIDMASGIINGSSILPLTLRQIFYMLVTRHGYDKDEKSYKYLCEAMNKARRARMVDMNDIRDDGLQRKHTVGWISKTSMIATFKRSAINFTLDRQRNQETKVYIWCEAGGMVPQLHDAVKKWHIPVLSSGGFDSVTTKHNLAKELGLKKRVVVLHLGDHDPSGVHMFGSLDEDLQAFMYEIREEEGYDCMEYTCDLERIAVTPDQVDEMGLPTSPPKATDKRSFSGWTTQCEAIEPEDLRDIVQDAVSEYIDEDIYDEDLARELEIRAELKIKLGDI